MKQIKKLHRYIYENFVRFEKVGDSALNANNQIIEQWIEEYSRLILTICYSMTKDYFHAEDLMQDTFLSAYKNLENFDYSNPKAWLTTIASNKCRDFLKRAERRTSPGLDTIAETRDIEPLPEEVILRQDAEEKIKKVCLLLKEPYQTISLEHFYYNKSVDQIAEETGKNKKTLQTQLYRSKSMLKDLWKEEYPCSI